MSSWNFIKNLKLIYNIDSASCIISTNNEYSLKFIHMYHINKLLFIYPFYCNPEHQFLIWFYLISIRDILCCTKLHLFQIICNAWIIYLDLHSMLLYISVIKRNCHIKIRLSTKVHFCQFSSYGKCYMVRTLCHISKILTMYENNLLLLSILLRALLCIYRKINLMQ